MKKLLAILLAMTMLFAFAACASEESGPAPSEPKGTEAPPATEPKVTEEPPIEISEFGPAEDMPAPFGGEDPVGFSDGSIAVTVGDETYTAEWLYWHNIYDWRQAGITYEQVGKVTDAIVDLPFNDDALAGIKAKISDFTMIMMLEAPVDINTSAPAITLDDEVYDVAWLSSHNATDYKEVGIPADTVKQYLDALKDDFWYTYEYRWIEEVYSRMTK